MRKEINASEIVSLPLTHPHGEAQVDFGKTVFYEQGERFEGRHLVVTYPQSNARFVQLFKGENAQCLFEGLKTIFEHVGGVPTVIRFDNMSSAVAKIKENAKRIETDGMQRFKCHYGFKSVYCNPASGNEKGSVENAVGYIRRNFFVPMPKVDQLEEYNKKLLTQCDQELKERHYSKEICIQELFEKDKEAFLPLPGVAFEAVRYAQLKTDHSGRISFETNKYSTGGSNRKEQVIVTAGAHYVEIHTQKGEFIVKHPR